MTDKSQLKLGTAYSFLPCDMAMPTATKKKKPANRIHFFRALVQVVTKRNFFVSPVARTTHEKGTLQSAQAVCSLEAMIMTAKVRL